MKNDFLERSEQKPRYPSRQTVMKNLRKILTDQEELELWRYWLTKCPDDKVRFAAFQDWNNRTYGKAANTNINLNADITPPDASQQLLSQSTIDAIVGDLKSLPSEQEQPQEAEFSIREVKASSEVIDKNLTIDSQLVRLRQELFDESNAKTDSSEI